MMALFAFGVFSTEMHSSCRIDPILIIVIRFGFVNPFMKNEKSPALFLDNHTKQHSVFCALCQSMGEALDGLRFLIGML